MNRLVREHYPVSQLPEDLREGFEGQTDVRVTIDVAARPGEPPEPASGGFFERHKHVRQSNFTSGEDVDAYVRSLRDE